MSDFDSGDELFDNVDADALVASAVSCPKAATWTRRRFGGGSRSPSKRLWSADGPDESILASRMTSYPTDLGILASDTSRKVQSSVSWMERTPWSCFPRAPANPFATKCVQNSVLMGACDGELNRCRFLASHLSVSISEMASGARGSTASPSWSRPNRLDGGSSRGAQITRHPSRVPRQHQDMGGGAGN